MHHFDFKEFCRFAESAAFYLTFAFDDKAKGVKVKFFLHIGEKDYELKDEDLRNWDEIRCSYKRANYDGVVRSFTSQFAFVNRANELLTELYLRDRFNAQASISVHTMNDRWEYVKQFECPLDFSTISWESYTLKINSVDNSLAALIKAKKSTKYEYELGKDIIKDRTLVFDRIPMIENVTYAFTQGSQYDNGDIIVTFKKDIVPWLGSVSNEISVKSPIYWKDDQDPDDGGYCLKAEKPTQIKLEYDLSWKNKTTGGVELFAKIKRNGEFLDIGTSHDEGNGGSICAITAHSYHSFGPYSNPGQFPDAQDTGEELRENGGIFVYATLNDGSVYKLEYIGGSGTYSWINTGLKDTEEFLTQSQKGSLLLNLNYGDFLVITSDVFGADSNIVFSKSEFKFSWIATGDKVNIDIISPENVIEKLLYSITGNTISVNISDYDPRIKNTYLLAAESARGISGAKFYSSFNEFCDWMSTVFGYIYTINEDNSVNFLHRSELLNPGAHVRNIKLCRDLKYSVDTSAIYSTITVGYDKKDYDSINGRDEFNFSNTYSTGCKVSDKTLSLISKYRADCYGIEFAVQKRGEDTTDSSADQDVFFLLCATLNGTLVPDRSLEIENSITGAVFNGAFSPMACIRANAGLVGLQADTLNLSFASSTGNSTIVIDGEPMNADIELDNPIATCGTIEFTTNEVEDIADIYELIEVVDDCVIYRGFLKEVDLKFARTESAKYKLIIKDIEVC